MATEYPINCNDAKSPTDVIRKALTLQKKEEYYYAYLWYKKGIDMIKDLIKDKDIDKKSRIESQIQLYVNRQLEILKILKKQPTGIYSWNIFGLQQIQLLCSGYIRNNHTKYTPIDIVNLCILYYNTNYINTIKNANNKESFCSPIFAIGPFKWRLVIYPNGDRQQFMNKFMFNVEICSLSPTISQMNFYYKLTVLETDIIYYSFTRVLHHELATQLSHSETLNLESIKELESISFNLELKILHIIYKDGTRGNYETKPIEMKVPFMKHAVAKYTWNVPNFSGVNHYFPDDPSYDILRVFQDVRYSEIFTIHNIKWHLMYFPLGFDEMEDSSLILRAVSIPPNIALFVIDLKILCIETGINIFERGAEFTDNQDTTGWLRNTMTIDLLKNIKTLTFMIDIILIDVFDKNGLVITDQYIDIKNDDDDDDDDDDDKLYGNYIWKIFDELSMIKIKMAMSGDVFYSPIFKMQSLKWIMKVCIASDLEYDDNLSEDDYNYSGLVLCLYLVSIPPLFESICIKWIPSLQEMDSERQDFWTFTHKENMLIWEPEEKINIETLDSLTFKMDIEILDIYDKNGYHINDFHKLESMILSMKPEDYTWNITDITIIELLKDAQCGIVYQSKCFQLNGFEWFLSFYPNGVNITDKGSVILCLNINEKCFISENISSISFKYELLFLETGTVISEYTHFNSTFKCKGWTKRRLKLSQIQQLKTFTFKVMIKLVDVYDKNGYAITYKYKT